MADGLIETYITCNQMVAAEHMIVRQTGKRTPANNPRAVPDFQQTLQVVCELPGSNRHFHGFS
jgi:hypothetical protein